MTKVFRQGDVLLIAVDKLPAKAKELPRDEHNRIVLAYGEATGHAHAIREKNVTAFRAETAEDAALAGLPKVDYILVGGSSPAVVQHEYTDGRQAEHDPITLDPGVYQIAAQVEYTPQALMRVSD